MDRQALDFATASAMAYAQQQLQTSANMQQSQPFGFRPQHQQFPPSVHGPPFLPPHPSMQQFPFHHPLQQLHPSHHPPHPHLLHFQQQQQQQAPPSFPPHLPSSVSPPFHRLYDSAPPPQVPPPPIPPPSDTELQKRIDKLAEYSLKNGPEFEEMIREKQQDNPAYSFLFGGEGHGYYRYKLWLNSHSPPGGVFNPSFPPSSISMMHASPNTLINPPPMNAPAAPAMGVPPMHQFAQFYEQQPHHLHAFGAHGQAGYDQSLNSFKGLSGPLPSDVASELNNVLSNLTGAKESIKGAKAWFMQRSPFAPALAEALRDRIFTIDDSDRQLHIIYLVNDILFESLPRRTKTHELDNEALAFKPVLGPMLARVYHNPNIKQENQTKLQTLVQFWLSREIYDQNTINAFEGEIMNGPPANSFPGIPKDFPTSGDLAAGLPLYSTNLDVPHWQHDRKTSVPGLSAQEHPHPDKHVIPGQAIPSSVPLQPFLPNSASTGVYGGPMPILSSIQQANQQAAPILLLPQSTQLGEKLPPYPLFPPGLIPGMVRKMQIGSGVPYSPMSPLDIPTVIPPSDITPSEVLERVSKFFKEIGEVNPSEGPMDSDLTEEDKYYERDSPVRKGGACIPPPANLQVDPETGTYADGSVDRKSGSGRLGLGASANPNEVSQYDDVYSSYRKQRSTNYHYSMSARTVTK